LEHIAQGLPAFVESVNLVVEAPQFSEDRNTKGMDAV
jgi:hypothetical protein